MTSSCESKPVRPVRLLLTDELWIQLEAVIKSLRNPAGRPPDLNIRLFLEAVLYIDRTGSPWRDLPALFGDWNAVYQRFRRWQKRSVWERLWATLQAEEFAAAKVLFIDSTVIRVHQHGAGAPKKKGGQNAQGIGRSRGGLTSKLHVAAVSELTAVGIVLTEGERHDSQVVDAVLEAAGLDENEEIQKVVMDKAYDSNKIRAGLKAKGLEAVIPSKKNRKTPIEHDVPTYKLRQKVERLFNQFKEFRRIATRYDKLAESYLSLVCLAAALIIIR